jgi:hypothetical protein
MNRIQRISPPSEALKKKRNETKSKTQKRERRKINMAHHRIVALSDSLLITSLVLSVLCVVSLLPVEVKAHGHNSSVSIIGYFRYRVKDPDGLYSIKLYNKVGSLVKTWSCSGTQYDIDCSPWSSVAPLTLDVCDRQSPKKWDDEYNINTLGNVNYSKSWPKGDKKQSMTFVVPFNLSELVIPGTLIFDLFPANTTEQSCILSFPDWQGRGDLSLNFLSGHQEIFYDYSAYDPNLIIFNITKCSQLYGCGTPMYGSFNATVYPEFSYGLLNRTSGEITLYATGEDTNKDYGVFFFTMIYFGYANLTANMIHLQCDDGVADFGPPPSGVGGVFVPVDKFGLLAPYVGLASTILVATAATAIYVKRVKRRKEKQ